VDGDYCPENCRLATMKEQCNNRRPYILEGSCEAILPPRPRRSGPKEQHGYARTKIYNVWLAMRDRCLNPNSKYFRHYGGRGIGVCERWDLFSNFLADMGEAPPGLTLDRIDVQGDYEPGNCRWASRLDQIRNRRKRIHLPAKQFAS